MYVLPMAICIVSIARSEGSAARQFNAVLRKTELKMLGAEVAKRERDRFILIARDPLIRNCYRFSHSERICRAIIQTPTLPGTTSHASASFVIISILIFLHYFFSNYWSRRFYAKYFISRCQNGGQNHRLNK